MAGMAGFFPFYEKNVKCRLHNIDIFSTLCYNNARPIFNTTILAALLFTRKRQYIGEKVTWQILQEETTIVRSTAFRQGSLLTI